MHYYLLDKNKDKDKEKSYRKELKEYIFNNYEDIVYSIKDDNELSIEVKLFKLNYFFSRLYVNSNRVLRKLKLKSQSKPLKKIKL